MKDITYHNKTEKEALEYTSKIIDFGVTLIVYAALNELLSSCILLKQSKYYRQNIKRRANEALRMRNAKEKELKGLVLYAGFAETYWDSVIDVAEEDVSKFREEIRRTMEEYGTEETELLSQMEAARILLQAAKMHYEEAIRDCTSKFMAVDSKVMKNLNLFQVFHEFYIANIFMEWDAVCDMVYDKVDSKAVIENEKVDAAFKALADKFARGEYIKGCLEITGEEYPEFKDVKIKIVEE